MIVIRRLAAVFKPYQRLIVRSEGVLEVALGVLGAGGALVLGGWQLLGHLGVADWGTRR